MKRIGWLWAFILLAFGVTNMAANGAFAQDGGQSQSSGPSEIDRIKAETQLVAARAAYEKAVSERIAGLGIPQFKGETKANQGAGELEASMLSTTAIGEVAQSIAASVLRMRTRSSESSAPAVDRPIIVLAGTEAFDAGIVGVVRWQMDSLCTQFAVLLAPRTCDHPDGPAAASPNRTEFILALPALIPIASALFGAARSEVEVTGVTTKGVTDAMLTRAIAARLEGHAILPSAAIVTPEDGTGNIPRVWGALSLLRARAEVEKAAATGDENKERRERLGATIARYDTFASAMVTADAQGVPPIARAARLERMFAAAGSAATPYVLRAFVDQAGGSLVNTRNIGTFVGLDPLRVSGGAITSYTLTDPANGAVVSSGLYLCQTALVRLPRAHDGRWRNGRTAPLCTDVVAAPARPGGSSGALR
jgi:hypothetical protein